MEGCGIGSGEALGSRALHIKIFISSALTFCESQCILGAPEDNTLNSCNHHVYSRGPAADKWAFEPNFSQ